MRFFGSTRDSMRKTGFGRISVLRRKVSNSSASNLGREIGADGVDRREIRDSFRMSRGVRECHATAEECVTNRERSSCSASRTCENGQRCRCNGK